MGEGTLQFKGDNNEREVLELICKGEGTLQFKGDNNSVWRINIFAMVEGHYNLRVTTTIREFTSSKSWWRNITN